ASRPDLDTADAPCRLDLDERVDDGPGTDPYPATPDGILDVREPGDPGAGSDFDHAPECARQALPNDEYYSGKRGRIFRRNNPYARRLLRTHRTGPRGLHGRRYPGPIPGSGAGPGADRLLRH